MNSLKLPYTLFLAFFCVLAVALNCAEANNRFDLTARGMLRIPSPQGRKVANLTSDILQNTLILSPFVVDGYNLIDNSDKQRNWRPLVGDAAAFGVTLGLTTLVKGVTKRERPFAEECRSNGGYDPSCGTATSNKSFFSGHTSMAFTSAALMCSNSLRTTEVAYGVCFGALGVATATGILRIVADKHHATDVLVGAAVGTVSGVFVPKLLKLAIGPKKKKNTETEKEKKKEDLKLPTHAPKSE